MTPALYPALFSTAAPPRIWTAERGRTSEEQSGRRVPTLLPCGPHLATAEPRLLFPLPWGWDPTPERKTHTGAHSLLYTVSFHHGRRVPIFVYCSAKFTWVLSLCVALFPGSGQPPKRLQHIAGGYAFPSSAQAPYPTAPLMALWDNRHRRVLRLSQYGRYAYAEILLVLR